MEEHNIGQFTTAVFVDLRKAFDTIDHAILLSKLYAYGIRNRAHDWFTSYLTHRSQRVMVNGSFSNYQYITHGVPQGSVLGPVLFLLYINDVVNIINPETVYLYADDTVLYVSGTERTAVQTKLQNILDRFLSWCISNKLTLNAKKNKMMTFFLLKNQSNVDHQHRQLGLFGILRPDTVIFCLNICIQWFIANVWWQ